MYSMAVTVRTPCSSNFKKKTEENLKRRSGRGEGKGGCIPSFEAMSAPYRKGAPIFSDTPRAEEAYSCTPRSSQYQEEIKKMKA